MLKNSRKEQTESRRKKSWPLHVTTKNFIREGRKTGDFGFFDLMHGYVYLRWPYLYIGIATGEHPLARLVLPLYRWITKLLPVVKRHPELATFADGYHGKVMPVEAAQKLVKIKREIRVDDLEQVIPYTKARSIIMHNPDHIVALECPCRAARPQPCEPLDVCLIVGEPFTSFVIAHHPHKARWITPQEAADIIQAEHDRGHVQHAFFKDAMLGRFYAICNCCACCCGAMQAWQHGVPMLAASGYVAEVSSQQCAGCGTCVIFCQFNALTLDDEPVQIDHELCMGCGVCVSKCACEALQLVRAPEKGEPLEVTALTNPVSEI